MWGNVLKFWGLGYVYVIYICPHTYIHHSAHYAIWRRHSCQKQLMRSMCKHRWRFRFRGINFGNRLKMLPNWSGNCQTVFVTHHTRLGQPWVQKMLLFWIFIARVKVHWKNATTKNRLPYLCLATRLQGAPACPTTFLTYSGWLEHYLNEWPWHFYIILIPKVTHRFRVKTWIHLNQF